MAMQQTRPANSATPSLAGTLNQGLGDVGCPHCSSLYILKDSLPESELSLSVSTTPVAVHITLVQLKASVRAGCCLCEVLSKIVESLDVPTIESVAFHPCANGGPLDMVVWLQDETTQYYEIFTRLSK